MMEIDKKEFFNDVEDLYNHSAFFAYKHQQQKTFRKPQYTYLQQLASLIKDGHSVTLPRQKWCEVLATDPKHLNRKLSLLGADLVNIETSRNSNEVSTGYIKISVNPAYIFVGTKKAREYAVLEWYVSKGLETFDTLKDWYVSEAYQSYRF